MKQTLIAIALAAAMPFAFAQSNSTSGSSANSSPNVTSGNTASESSSASQSNPNNANQQFIQLNTLTPEQQRVQQDVRYSGTQTIKNVPGIAMSGPASGPCTGASGGLGVAGPGFGVGLNGSKVDDGCTVRENSRVQGQLYQALDSNDPLKVKAKEALDRSLAILDAMNEQIGEDYLRKQRERRADTQPAKVVTAAPAPATTAATSDPYIKASGRQYPSPK